MDKLTIERANNGYVLSWYNAETTNNDYIVVEDDDTQGNEARLAQKLLIAIQEYLGLLGSKHDEERCYVELRNKEGKEIV